MVGQEHRAANGHPEAPPHQVDRADLDGARRRSKKPVPEAGQAWTACAAPSNLLVIDARGRARTCDYGACAWRPPKGGLPALWDGADITRLRVRLAEASMPLSNCSACVDWLRDDLLAAAPPVRDYGHLPMAAAVAGPRVLVVQLPRGRPTAQVVSRIRPLLGGLETLVVEADATAVAAAAPLLEALRAAPDRPALSLRIRGEGMEAVADAVQGLVVREIEFTAESHAGEPLDAAKALAEALGAALRVRFVFTPGNWFEFEDLARACAARGLALDLRVLDRGGSVPLASLPLDHLRFVKNVTGSMWPRCGGPDRPGSIADQAFDDLGHELRQLLRRCAEAALAAGGDRGGEARLGLPPLDHPWNVDALRRSWWWNALFGEGHLELVRDWVASVAAAADGDQLARGRPWFRQLVQRVAAETRRPELLDLLRRIYAEDGGRTVLAASDQEFATELDLTRFGGPWAAQLGLLPAPARRRPFEVGPARRQKRGAAADVTVLIPSYRHEAFVEETIRSVLAQDYVNLRVLVVDDRSPDATVERARSIQDPRIEVRQNEKNVGLGNSVLQALESIETPYVALLNSDDLFHPERLSRCRDVLETQPGVQLVTTAIQLIDQSGGELTPRNASLALDGRQVFDWVHWFERATPPTDLPQRELFAALLERNFLVTSSNLVARTDWLRAQAGALRSLKYCLDWQLFLEAALQGALHHVHEPLIAYRLHATNTVWFREGRRWSYYLEVNRVAAEALRRYAAHGSGGRKASVPAVVAAVTEHLVRNGETDGFALFLNSALDALQLDHMAEESPRVQQLVQALNEQAERIRAARDRRETTPAEAASAAQRRLLGDLGREQAQIERNHRRWLQGYVDSLEGRLRESWTARERLDQDKKALHEQKAELERRVQQLAAEARKLEEQRASLQRGEQSAREQSAALEKRVEGLQRDLAGVRGDVEAARGAAAAVRDLKEIVAAELKAVRAERDGLRGERDRVAAERDGLRGERDRVAAEREGLRGEHGKLRGERDRVAAERDGLRGERDRVAAERDGLRGERDRVAAERDGLRGEHGKLRGEHERLRIERDDLHSEHQRLTAERDALAGEHRRLTVEHEELCAARDRLESAHEALAAELAAAKRGIEEAAQREAATLQALARERASLASARAEGEALRSSKASLDGEFAAAKKQGQDLRSERDSLAKGRQELEAALARETAQARQLAEAKAKLEQHRNELVHHVAKVNDEMQALRRTREFRTGNFVWNKMPLGYLSRRGKKWYRRLLDAKNRFAMWGSRMLGRRHRADGVAVVAACWQWPIYSHTFVYQEMLGLTHMGLDVRLFHWDLGDTAQLHAAFRYLYENRTQLQPIWENHLKDKEHFEKTKPGRLRAFLERVSAATGRSVADLEKEPLVVQGCTFARMAELAGARYLHSYFFYDQSFMVMQAAWLLEVPRGVSCYADHMMDDYPFKLVPLQVELADVIVATSARIKRELSGKTGGKYDDKIIVKPNGVDGARFPAVDRGPRQQGEPFEVVSISRIEPKKGLIHLVEAVAELKKRGRPVIAHVIGSKDQHSKGSLEYAAEFEQRIAELGVGDQVVLHGMMKQEQLPPILQRCRAFVAPYVETASGDKDGIPTAMLEALASRLPVVTTDSGSILEVVDDSVEGFVVPQRDSMAFADALQRLIDDPALERRMANAARARFDREFDIRVTEKRLHERVAALVAAKARAR